MNGSVDGYFILDASSSAVNNYMMVQCLGVFGIEENKKAIESGHAEQIQTAMTSSIILSMKTGTLLI